MGDANNKNDGNPTNPSWRQEENWDIRIKLRSMEAVRRLVAAALRNVTHSNLPLNEKAKMIFMGAKTLLELTERVDRDRQMRDLEAAVARLREDADELRRSQHSEEA